ncbi:hypothetical protein [Streptomyces longwoodensis]|uniref:hypothetical protein n=1 Tax=Streptomyces longwoodensis TaxID=68231 RepID=UPI00381A6DF0
MPEGREQPPTPQACARPAVGISRLSPMQQAYAAYTEHATSCGTCRDPDAGKCETAERLWKAYHETADRAFTQFVSET